MTTSGTITFGLVLNELIEEAFNIAGMGSEGEAITADMYARGKRSLNLLVKALSAHDHLWLRTSQSVALAAGTASYALSPRPKRIIDVRRKVTATGIETPLTEWSRTQYDEMPNKVVQSIPTAYYYDPQLNAGNLYVWPTASSATASTTTLQVTYLRTVEDFVDSGNSADLPQEWHLALSYLLAEQLALKYGVAPDIRQEIAARAQTYKADIESFDTEPASLFMQPDCR